MIVTDSRRITGPSLVLDCPGAVLEVHLDDAARDRAIDRWRIEARRLLEAVGWGGEAIAVRRFGGGASLGFTAPVDALYAAAELNEAAWAAAAAAVEGVTPPDHVEAVERLRAAIAEECSPSLVALREAARAHEVTFLAGEDLVSVGSGTGAQVWPADALPPASTVDWSRVHDVPVALVTGSNGKTTVVRLLAAMLAEAGRVVGLTSTDGVSADGVMLADGDYSGPSGARLLLRRPEIEAAVLETARGGLLRRGLAVTRAAVAVVTNVADDHLGEFGVQEIGALADLKLLVTRAVGPGGAAVLNADNALLRERAGSVAVPIVWFSLEPDRPDLRRHLDAGGRAALAEDEVLVLAEGASRTPVARVDEVPSTIGGTARHNVANALAAIGAAAVLGVPVEVIGRTLRRFGQATGDNAGRANVVELAGVRLVIDYAHNPHGMAALAHMAAAMPARRKLVLIGQAGDRPDEAIRELVRSALAVRPDRVVLKELERYLRGRAPGEVPGIMADELARLGVPPAVVSRPGSEIDSVREALAWSRPGDVLLLTVHQDLPLVLALIDELRTSGWRPGEPMPVAPVPIAGDDPG